MSEQSGKFINVSRRGFLKFAAFTGAGITLGKYLRDSVLRYEMFEERWGEGLGIESWRLSICRQCPAGCGLRVRLVDGNAVKLDGNSLCPIGRGTLCPKGQAGLQALYDPDRLLGPVRRAGPRGSNRWERIGWDQAMAEVRTRLDALRAQGQPERLAWLAERNDATEGRLLRRFMRAFGSPNLFELVDLRDDAAASAMYFCQGVEEHPAYDLENTSYVLSFGTPVLESWLSPTWMARQFGHLHRGRPERRGRLVQIETRLSPTAANADEWIPIVPGSEAALALAIAHVMIREDLYDRPFVEEQSFGFADWMDAAGRKHAGFRTLVLREYAPNTVAETTGVPVTTILRLARELADNKPAVVLGEQVPLSGGISLAWAVHALNGLNGMIDRKGGVLLQRHLPLKPLPELAPDEVAKRGLTQPLAVSPPGTFPTKSIAIPALAQAIAEGRPYPLQALLVSGSRFFTTAPEADAFFQAVGKIPFIVSFSSTLDDSAAFADLILPDHSPLEKWLDTAPLPVSGTPIWGVSEPALPPLLDTRHLGKVVIELGRRLNGPVAAAFPWQDMPEVLRFVAEGLFEARRGAPYATSYETAWVRQLEAGGWWIPSARSYDEFWQQLLDRGGWHDPIYPYERWRRVFKTPSGKFEFASQSPAVQLSSGPGHPAEDGQLLPRFVPPAWAGDQGEYPLLLKVFTGLATGGLSDPNQAFLQEALTPLGPGRWENWVELHPHTAQSLGIADGDQVWLESPLGKLRLRARLYPGTMPGVAGVLIGHEHWAGGRYVKRSPRGVADLVAYRPDPTGLGVMAQAATTRVKVYKA